MAMARGFITDWTSGVIYLFIILLLRDQFCKQKYGYVRRVLCDCDEEPPDE